MITILNILILAASSLLTLSFLPHFRIFGAVAILPLFFIIQLAYFRKGFEPLLLAALTGVFFDLFSPYLFGFYLVFFLITAGLTRFFFDEGLRRLSFWHYQILVGVAVSAYYLVQLVWLYFEGTKPTIMVLPPIAWGFVVNLIFAAIYYGFGLWYFEKVIKIENRIKRR